MEFEAVAEIVQGAQPVPADIAQPFVQPVRLVESGVRPQFDRRRAAAAGLVLDQTDQTRSQPGAARRAVDIELLQFDMRTVGRQPIMPTMRPSDLSATQNRPRCCSKAVAMA